MGTAEEEEERESGSNVSCYKHHSRAPEKNEISIPSILGLQ
jgi:hypothetical protein